MGTFEGGNGVWRVYASHVGRLGRERAALWLAAASVSAIGQAALAAASGGVAAALVRDLARGDIRSSPVGAPTAVTGLADDLVTLCVAGVVALTVKWVASVYATYVQGRVSADVGSSLRLAVLDALLSLHRLRRPRHGDQGSGPPAPSPALAVASMTESVRAVEAGLERGVLGGVRAIAQLVPLAALLVFLSPRAAAIAIATMAAFGVALGRARRRHGIAAHASTEARADLVAAADEAIRHADLWVAYGAEAKARARVAQLGEAIAARGARLAARASALSGANEVLGGVALLAAVLAARAGWAGSGVDGGRLLAFVFAFFLTYRPTRDLGEARLTLARASAAYASLDRLLSSVPATPPQSPEPLAATTWEDEALELRDLQLARGRCAALSLRVEPGTVVAIAGPTGVGKTTLLRTLLGLESPASGEVLYGGRPLCDAPAGPSSRPFAWVPQDAPLVADTLDANLRLGAGEEDAARGLADLGADALARDLGPAKLGAGGRPVSGGERQWIALARAIATRQPVLLLDEPTSGMDPGAQRLVLEAIGRMRGRRTVLLVTHRPEPLAVADRVIRLEVA